MRKHITCMRFLSAFLVENAKTYCHYRHVTQVFSFCNPGNKPLVNMTIPFYCVVFPLCSKAHKRSIRGHSQCRAVATRFEVVRFDKTRYARPLCPPPPPPPPPENFWIFRPSEIISDAIFGVKEQELLHACLALKTYTLTKL